MTRNFLKISVSALTLSVVAGSALAGGYGRGSANLDPLMDEGTSVTSSMAVTSPSRSMASVGGVATNAATGVDFAETYTTFGATLAAKIVGDVRCAGSYVQPFGAKADYGNSRILADFNGAVNTGPNTTSNDFSSSEFGLTCAYGVNAGPGRAFVMGGLFYQSLDYQEIRGFGQATINMTDQAVGYRLGVGYTIPEVAFKASLMYRSSVDHRMTGTQTVGPVPFAIFADATTPQSVKLSLQTGVAEGWLVFGSVEWTDWSVLQRVAVNCANPVTLPPILGGTSCVAGGPSIGFPSIDAYFGDGWTVNAGVGHKFNDLISASASVTWDKGVSQAFAGAKRSTFTDTWTVALGAAFTPNATSSLRAGLAYSFLSGGTETGLGGGQTIVYGDSHAISGGVSANFKF